MPVVFITKANYICEYKIELYFSDGSYGNVDLQPYLQQGIFKSLQEEETFRSFTLNSWTIEWPNGADFAPEFLHNIANKNLNLV